MDSALSRPEFQVIPSSMSAGTVRSPPAPAFVCTDDSGLIGMARISEAAQGTCQDFATIPLEWTRRVRRCIATDTHTGLLYAVDRLLF